jgi:hypothetical protein
MTAWSSHLQGAATLLETRGVDLSKCILGRKGLKLFLQFRSQLVKDSNYGSFPLSPNLETVDQQPTTKPKYS